MPDILLQKRLYDELAAADGDAADGYYRHAGPGFRLRRVAEAVDRHRPQVLLDAGCGDGVLMAEIERSSAVLCIGVDLSEVSLARAKGRGLAVCGDLAHLPLKAGTVDVAVAAEVLEHVDSPDEVLAELRLVLKPSGRLIATVPVADWFKLIKGALLRAPVKYLDQLTHRREWSAVGFGAYTDIRELFSIIATTGYSIRLLRGIFYYGWRMERSVDDWYLAGRRRCRTLWRLDSLLGRLPLVRCLGKYLLIEAAPR